MGLSERESFAGVPKHAHHESLQSSIKKVFARESDAGAYLGLAPCRPFGYQIPIVARADKWRYNRP
eukprot:scaffold10660_cov176-Amphora_coffeaeformis.AAC.5